MVVMSGGVERICRHLQALQPATFSIHSSLACRMHVAADFGRSRSVPLSTRTSSKGHLFEIESLSHDALKSDSV
jgi:hypothetical protein